MKKTILEVLKRRFEGVQDVILDRIADKIVKTAKTTEEATTAADALTFQQVLESYGDSRATEAATTAVSNYEKKNKDANPVETQQSKDVQAKTSEVITDESMPAWAKAIVEQNSQLKTELDTFKLSKTTETRQQQLAATIAPAPATIKNFVEKGFGKMAFSSDEDFNTYLNGVKQDVETFAAEQQVKGATFGQPFKPINKIEEVVPQAILDHLDAKKSNDGQPF